MNIEAGKRYVRRDGKVSGRIVPAGYDKVSYPYEDSTTGTAYTCTGMYNISGTHSWNDLVEEYEPEEVWPKYYTTVTPDEYTHVERFADGTYQAVFKDGRGRGPSLVWMYLDDVHRTELTKEQAMALLGNKPTEPMIRIFESGATRNLDNNKLDYEGFLSPAVLHAFAEYMHGKRTQADGTVRDSDNWQKGIPIDQYMKSMFRHFMDVWTLHRGSVPVQPETGKPIDYDEAFGGLLFNVQGMWHEIMKMRSKT